MLSEFKTDYNQTHFVRNETFKKAAENIQGPNRKIFIEFLERSCTAEFSGFLLYKELGRRLKKTNPVGQCTLCEPAVDCGLLTQCKDTLTSAIIRQGYSDCSPLCGPLSESTCLFAAELGSAMPSIVPGVAYYDAQANMQLFQLKVYRAL